MEMNRFFTLETESQNLFIQVPKIFMVEESKYFKMSAMSKLLYGVLSDRNKLSIKNGWIDDLRRVFFLYSQTDIGKMLGIKDTKTVRKYLKELESIGLLHRERQGLNMPDRLYLLQVEVSKSQSYQLIGENPLSGQEKIPCPNEGKSPTNNNKINNNKTNNNKSTEQYNDKLKSILSCSDLSDEEAIDICLEKKIKPNDIEEKEIVKPAVPKEYKKEFDRSSLKRFEKDRSFYGINFENGEYYNIFAEAVNKTQQQDNIEVIKEEQYNYFRKTLLNKLNILSA